MDRQDALRIVHLNMFGKGGAARAAKRLHDGLCRLGHDSLFFLNDAADIEKGIMIFDQRANLVSRALRSTLRKRIESDFAPYRNHRTEGQELFSDDRSVLRSDLRLQLPPSEVINLHWVAGFIDYWDFLSTVPRQIPVVWTLHDMNPFTGGCHYDEGCGKFANACGACPQLGSSEETDLSRRIWTRKKKAFESVPPGRMYVVGDSRWLAAEAKRSSLLGKFPISSIHYGLDVECFAPRDKLSARKVLGIPSEAFVIMFAADSVAIRRKGLSTLVEALGSMTNAPNLLVLSAGRGVPRLPTAIRHMHLGHVESDLMLSMLYSAADVFVIPSVQEAFGQTALEAMACGTPVIGSNVGGIPEVVCHGVTGYLVPPLAPLKLREALTSLLGDPIKRAEMSNSCRQIVVQEYNLEVQARNYVKLYEEILWGRSGDPTRNSPPAGRSVDT